LENEYQRVEAPVKTNSPKRLYLHCRLTRGATNEMSQKLISLQQLPSHIFFKTLGRKA
jgi:hypothetical protein